MMTKHAAVLAFLVGISALFAPLASAADLLHGARSEQGVTGVPLANSSGFYLGITAGADLQKVTGGENVNLDGAIVGGRLGYDRAFSGLVAGIFADVNYSTAHGGGATAALSYDVGARLGVPLGGSLLYVNGGPVWKNFSVPEGSYNPNGWFAGAGIQSDLGGGFAVGIEGRREWTGSSDVDNVADQIKIMLLKKF